MFGNESIRKPPLTLLMCAFISLSPQHLTRSIHPTLQLESLVCLINHWILIWENKRMHHQSIKHQKQEVRIRNDLWLEGIMPIHQLGKRLSPKAHYLLITSFWAGCIILWNNVYSPFLWQDIGLAQARFPIRNPAHWGLLLTIYSFGTV